MFDFKEAIAWHKVTKRPPDAEELAEAERIYEYAPEYILDCELPEDGQEILIATKWGVDKDICCVDEGYGLEAHGDWDDVIAWAPMPKYSGGKPAELDADVLGRAIETYGVHAQVDMAIEEMSELTKALCKERRTELKQGSHAEAAANVIEEIADVAIMLQQLIMIFDKDNEVPKEIEYKTERLAQRLAKHGAAAGTEAQV